jgi:hypothetical protein
MGSMADAPELAAIVGAAAAGRGLRPRDDVREAGWRFWELRNINIHRVVGLLADDRTFPDVAALGDELRGGITRNFRRAWWRGLAFGVVADVAALGWSPADLTSIVDGYENRRGVLQWVVLRSRASRSAIGVHTWEQVYLSPVYQMITRNLAANGFSVQTVVKGKDGVWRVLTEVAELEGMPLPEYRDRP